jgi:hypothetical protein
LLCPPRIRSSVGTRQASALQPASLRCSARKVLAVAATAAAMHPQLLHHARLLPLELVPLSAAFPPTSQPAAAPSRTHAQCAAPWCSSTDSAPPPVAVGQGRLGLEPRRGYLQGDVVVFLVDEYLRGNA